VPTPGIDRLRAPANFQLYELKKPLSKTAVEQAFKLAMQTATGRAIGRTVRTKRSSAGQTYSASFIALRLKQETPFLPGSGLIETTFGFILLVELEHQGKRFLGVFTHEAPSLADWVRPRTRPVSRVKFAHAFTGASRVKRLSVRRMTASSHELHAASYEAPDLHSSLPMIAASRSVVRSIRFDEQALGSIAVTIGTSRVQQHAGRQEIDDLARLVRRVVEQVEANKTDDFLANFAQAITVSDLPAGTVPTSVLFHVSDLLEDASLTLYRRPAPGDAPTKLLRKEKLIRRVLDGTLPVTADADGQFAIGPDAAKPRGKLRETASGYTMSTILRNRVVVRDAQSRLQPLAAWVRENDAYSITFSQPEYFYTGGGLYRRASFASEVAVVTRCLRPEEALSLATSEKGTPSPTNTQFPGDSVFGIVEQMYAPFEWLYCGDLGDEWADFVCVKNGTLMFLHCKHGTTTTGGADFQDVVGQGLKNLGRVQSTPSAFRAKLQQVSSTAASRRWGNTQIERLRGGADWQGFRAAVDQVLANPDARREVHLVVTMMSNGAFEAAAGAPMPYFIQQVWLLSSFINSCREMGARPVIVCKP
jgi:hypothetical protein